MIRLLGILIVLLARPAGAQDLENTVHPDFLLRVWQSEDGLPGNVVRSLGQTNDGFLWVSTAEGVARFDGLGFVPVQSTLASGERLEFYRVFVTADDRVWVSTFQGGLFEIRNLVLHRVVDIDREGSGGLIEEMRMIGGIHYFRRGGAFVRLGGDGEPGLGRDEVEEIFAVAPDDRRGRRVSPGEVPFVIDFRNGRWTLEPTNGVTNGESVREPERPGLGELDRGLPINEFFRDRQGNLWVATAGQGLIQVRRSRVVRFALEDRLHESAVITPYQTRDGTWWFGLRGGVVERVVDGVLTRYELHPGDYRRPVVCIHEDRSGRLWFAARDGSVFEWTGEGFEPRFSGTIEASKVQAIVEDEQGGVWFGGIQGLVRLAEGRLEVWQHELLAGAEITALALAGDGAILVGTADGRVLRCKGDSVGPIGSRNELDLRRVSSILPLGEGRLAVSTLGSGLFLRHDGRWVQIDERVGLPDKRLTVVVDDGRGSLWCGSLGGILRVSRDDLDRHLDDPAFRPRWLRLDRSDGLLTRECMGGGHPGAWMGSGGSIWFPTGKGIVGVNPAEIELHDVPPTLHLRPMRVDGRVRRIDASPVETGPGRVRLDFAFLGVDLSAPEKVTYRVRLVGLYDEMRSIGAQREVSYEAVPPGDYRFEVTALNGDGFAADRPATIDLRIAPRIWERPGFVSLAIVAGILTALALGGLVARRRMKQRIQALRVRGAREAERTRISRDLHDDLGASLTELSILSALAAEAPDDAPLRPALQNLSSKAKHVVEALDEIVWAANPTEDRLRSLIEYLCAFAREFLDPTEITFRTSIEGKIPDLPVGPNRRHNLVLAAREVLNNAVKHAQAGEVRLSARVRGQCLRVEIADDGLGFDPYNVKLGEGLASIRKRMNDCGGSAEFSPRETGGTLVTLTIPLHDPSWSMTTQFA